ncbi:CBS domain-containing protein [Paracoccus sp. S-4012]|uniref:CBS domain-containing protein n=1 Tax=Paracoccus sp. S-4012 TaxID=2665648 RepID=UPI0012AF34E5|nr:CBS domain-containing protein [Paracoccus sp. S-4012]MRX49478.1 CBS domain-containing protein [Paracoccus sp. S-4012]
MNTTAPTTIAHVLHRVARPLSPETQIREAAQRLVDGGLAALPVLDDAGRLVGILTQKDCFVPAVSASYYRTWKGAVADHMAREVQTLEAGTEIVEAARVFAESPHRVLVVMHEGAVAGMLDRSDVLAAVLAMS